MMSGTDILCFLFIAGLIAFGIIAAGWKMFTLVIGVVVALVLVCEGIAWVYRSLRESDRWWR